MKEEIKKISELKRSVGRLIHETPDRELPQILIYKEGLEFSKYKITIEVVQEDYFVDGKGQKWKKVNDDD
jgi:hypothetical protein